MFESKSKSGEIMTAERVVIFSQKYGIYLGSGVWSKADKAKTFPHAQTFPRGSQLTEFINTLPPEVKQDIELVVVVPDKAGCLCTMDKLAEYGLPRWGKDGAPKSIEEIKGEMG